MSEEEEEEEEASATSVPSMDEDVDDYLSTCLRPVTRETMAVMSAIQGRPWCCGGGGGQYLHFLDTKFIQPTLCKPSSMMAYELRRNLKSKTHKTVFDLCRDPTMWQLVENARKLIDKEAEEESNSGKQRAKRTRRA